MMNKINNLFGFLTHSVLFALMFFAFQQTTFADQTPEKPASCKIKRERLEENIEKYRRGETPFVDDKSYFMFCRSTRPVLEKYHLDPDRNIRNTIAGFLYWTYSKFNMRLLAAQVETYPLEYTVALTNLSNYKCKDLLKFKTERLEILSNKLIAETQKNPNLLANGAKTLLQCFAEKDEQARQFLVEKSNF
jgi:hypothetical protein